MSGNGRAAVDEMFLRTDRNEWERMQDRHCCALTLMTGVAVDPYRYPCDLSGLSGYLKTNGVRNFSAVELCTPWREELARELYPKTAGVVLPARWVWPRGALVAVLLQRIRDYINEPIEVLYWARPPKLNSAVKGAPKSDHLEGTGMDVKFRSARGITTAIGHILDPIYRTGLLQLSLGVGRRRMHIGALSSGGQRRWGYPSAG